MTREELIDILYKLPPGTEIFTRSQDNAWPTIVRVFNSCAGRTAFMDFKNGEHRNFPEKYSGAVEYTHEYVEGVTLEDERRRLAEEEFDSYDFGFETVEKRSKIQKTDDCTYYYAYTYLGTPSETHKLVITFAENSTNVLSTSQVLYPIFGQSEILE
jgi:hypothetical protein